MVVLHQTTGGSYLLVELDGAVSRLHYAAFWLIPYYSRLSSVIRITELTDMDDENLEKLAGEDVEEPDEEDQDSYESDWSRHTSPKTDTHNFSSYYNLCSTLGLDW